MKVAVLDTGIDRKHPDLAKAIESYVHTGFSATDVHGHGTHVAGIIAATANNRVGIAGVANCKLRCWKVFGDDTDDTGEESQDLEAYYKALGAVVETPGVKVLNLSLGGDEEDPDETDGIEALVQKGVLVVAAMGNEYEDGNPVSYPAAIPGVLAVGALGLNRRRASFSNTGRHIALMAPGSSIISTVPLRRSSVREETEYTSWDGTSMAAPFVVGAAALLWAKDSSLTATEVRDRLVKTATPLPAMRKKSWTPSYGSGLLNVRKALA